MASPSPLVTRRATKPGTGAVSRPTTRFLAFGLGGEAYAMDIRFVREVIHFEALTQVPLMPPFVRGVINLRGAVLPVVDLSVRFSRPETEASRRTCVVILELAREGRPLVLGVMVDSVSEVLELAADEIEPAPSFGEDPRAAFIQGVGKLGGKFVVLLDVMHLLSGEEASALSRSTDGGSSAP